MAGVLHRRQRHGPRVGGIPLASGSGRWPGASPQGLWPWASHFTFARAHGKPMASSRPEGFHLTLRPAGREGMAQAMAKPIGVLDAVWPPTGDRWPSRPIASHTGKAMRFA